ncbi:MAG: hypothetical protein HQL52_13905 [Magnetococcales bacterium]|nr:hypothetical protein [Magnetococcales bacterium]
MGIFVAAAFFSFLAVFLWDKSGLQFGFCQNNKIGRFICLFLLLIVLVALVSFVVISVAFSGYFNQEWLSIAMIAVGGKEAIRVYLGIVFGIAVWFVVTDESWTRIVDWGYLKLATLPVIIIIAAVAPYFDDLISRVESVGNMHFSRGQQNPVRPNYELSLEGRKELLDQQMPYMLGSMGKAIQNDIYYYNIKRKLNGGQDVGGVIKRLCVSYHFFNRFIAPIVSEVKKRPYKEGGLVELKDNMRRISVELRRYLFDEKWQERLESGEHGGGEGHGGKVGEGVESVFKEDQGAPASIENLLKKIARMGASPPLSGASCPIAETSAIMNLKELRKQADKDSYVHLFLAMLEWILGEGYEQNHAFKFLLGSDPTIRNLNHEFLIANIMETRTYLYSFEEIIPFYDGIIKKAESALVELENCSKSKLCKDDDQLASLKERYVYSKVIGRNGFAFMSAMDMSNRYLAKKFAKENIKTINEMVGNQQLQGSRPAVLDTMGFVLFGFGYDSKKDTKLARSYFYDALDVLHLRIRLENNGELVFNNAYDRIVMRDIKDHIRAAEKRLAGF